MEKESIIQLINKNIYVVEKNDYGHVILIMKKIYPKYFKDEDMKSVLINKIINDVKKSLEISKNCGKSTGYVHLYLTDCTMKNFSFKLFKQINNILNNTFEDTLERLYIYSNSVMFSNVWNMIKNLIDPDTRKKVQVLTAVE